MFYRSFSPDPGYIIVKNLPGFETGHRLGPETFPGLLFSVPFSDFNQHVYLLLRTLSLFQVKNLHSSLGHSWHFTWHSSGVLTFVKVGFFVSPLIGLPTYTFPSIKQLVTAHSVDIFAAQFKKNGDKLILIFGYIILLYNMRSDKIIYYTRTFCFQKRIS